MSINKLNVHNIYHTDDDKNSPFWSRIFSDNEEWKPNYSDKLFYETIREANYKNKRTENTKIKGMILGLALALAFAVNTTGLNNRINCYT